MEYLNNHPWLNIISAEIAPDKVKAPIADDNPHWEYIDSQTVKIGTISHKHVDIKEIQRLALSLLETETKDMRVLSNLLKTLQHNGNSAELFLAFVLFTRYIECYWDTAWPPVKLKARLAMQIIKRFDLHIRRFTENLTNDERNIIQSSISSLMGLWQNTQTSLYNELKQLAPRFSEKQSTVITSEQTYSTAQKDELPVEQTNNATIPAINISVDNSNERAWKNTLIKVSELLFEQFPDKDISYRLRRTAIWLTIDGVIIADENDITPLGIPISNDRLNEYLNAIPNATIETLRQVENSLTLSPYWFDGHLIAARMADQLGYQHVATAIHDEVKRILSVYPSMAKYKFSDKTPFVSPQIKIWLETTSSQSVSDTNDGQLSQEIWQYYDEKGLEAALQLLEKQSTEVPRTQFYHLLLKADLFARSGLTQLANQQKQHLHHLVQNMTVPEWEPAFIALITDNQNK